MSRELTWKADNGDGTYHNPIIYTDYSDPDVVRAGDDYYMVASSFCCTPAIPVLHSRDLVNWKLVSYVLENIPEPGYERPRHGCGVWAPSIRLHDGYFMVYYPMPDEGIFMCRAKDPAGPWSEPVCVKRAKGWIDPCPLWDDDKKAYLVNAFAKSRTGFKSILHVSEMSPDGTYLINEGVDVFDGHNTQPTIEGPKFYKRNGWYYIFAPAGGVPTGWQTVLRSRNVYGPYEEKIVMLQGGTAVNGPHQGGWTDTPCGEDWFIHFQDVGNAGRIVHLQPMTWENDWPVIGHNEGEGYGTPVLCREKPRTGNRISEETVSVVSDPESALQGYDDFSQDRLGLEWQWNANHSDSWFRLEHPGLRLFAIPSVKGEAVCDAPNLLLRKWAAPEFSVSAGIDISCLMPGDMAGLVSLGRRYFVLGFCREQDEIRMIFGTGEIGGNERFREFPPVKTEEIKPDIRLGMNVRADGTGSFLLNEGNCWKMICEGVSFTPGYWTGVKYGFFAVHSGKAAKTEAGSLFVKDVVVSEKQLTVLS